jgi:diguanylate cyclase (GGDEF)-like protein
MTKQPDDTVTEVAPQVDTQRRKAAACLLVISGKAIGRMFKLSKSDMLLGRGHDVDIIIDEVAISRRHARISIKSDGEVWLQDLDSKNGTYFEGERVTAVQLHDGDRFQVGSSTILKLTYQDNIEEEFQRQLYESATRDGLTRLFNKKFLLDRLSAEFAYCVRHQVTLSLCMFDIDHFKQINDQFGHVAGDAVLSQLGTIVGKASRTEDVFSRYGGEEFAVVLREIDSANAVRFAERTLKRIAQHDFAITDKEGQRQTIKLTISAGIATLNKNVRYATMDEFITAADKHLYIAKQAGRNRVSAGPS